MRSYLSLIALAFMAAPIMASAGEPVSCQAKWYSRSRVGGEFPGMILVHPDTPCRVSRYMGARARAAGFEIIQPPGHLSVRTEGRASLILTPERGFTGRDVLVTRNNFTRGFSRVRFDVFVQ